MIMANACRPGKPPSFAQPTLTRMDGMSMYRDHLSGQQVLYLHYCGAYCHYA